MNCHHLFERRIGALIALSFVSAVMLAASCGDDDDDDAMRPSTAEAGTKPVAAVHDAMRDDGGVHRESQALHVLITANTAAVDHATLAQAKASSDAVKEFAAKMIADHGAANERLATLAQQKKITPEANAVSDSLKSEADTFKSKLDPLSGATFDETYIYSELVAHVKVKSIIDEMLTPAVVDPELKRALADLRSVIEADHLRAQQIRAALGADASTARPDASTMPPGVPGQPDGGMFGRDSGLALPDPLEPGVPDPSGMPNEQGLPGLGGAGGAPLDGGFGFDFQ